MEEWQASELDRKMGPDNGAFLLYPVGRGELLMCFKQGDIEMCFRNIIVGSLVVVI